MGSYAPEDLIPSPQSKAQSINMDRNSLRNQCADTINSFLKDISYRYPALRFDPTLKTRVEDVMKLRGISLETIQRIQPYIDASVELAITSYSYTSPQIQEAVALFTAYAISIDDLGHEFPVEMRNFTSLLLLGQPQKNKFLQEACLWLTNYGPLFGQFAESMIAKSTMDFISGCYLELEREKLDDSASTTLEFAEYLRIKTGSAEAFAFFLFPEETFPEENLLQTYLPAVPHLVQYFNLVNDLLSFYKEAHEHANFINNNARAQNITLFQSLESIRKTTADHFHTIRAILSQNREVQEKIESFMYGYVVYHMCSRRYKLSELDVPAVFEARKLLFSTTNAQ
jgi:hypothetical protein